jgi:hypothetical protein
MEQLIEPLVIPGLVPGIQPSAGARASWEMDPGDKRRDDKRLRPLELQHADAKLAEA